MTPRLAFIDRLLTIVVGLAIVAGGLVLIDWQLGYVLTLSDELSTGAVADVAGTAWFPWALAGGGVVLGLLGLWWALAHLPRPSGTTVRTEASDADGALRVDVSSIADAAADAFAQRAPVLGASGHAHRIGGTDVIEVRASIDLRADAALVHEVAARTSQEVSASTSAVQPATRVLLDAPRRLSRLTTSGPARVH